MDADDQEIYAKTELPWSGVKYSEVRFDMPAFGQCTCVSTIPPSTSVASANSAALRVHNPYAPVLRRQDDWRLTSPAEVLRLARAARASRKYLAVSVAARGTSEMYTVVGKLSEGPGYDLELSCSRCRSCGEWRADDTVFPLAPCVAHLSFFNAEVRGDLPATGCACEDDDEVDPQDVELSDVDNAEEGEEPTTLQELHSDFSRFQQELLPDASLAPATTKGTHLTGQCASKWFLVGENERPAHVHSLTWNGMAADTRRSHLRWLRLLRDMPKESHGAPLATALGKC